MDFITVEIVNWDLYQPRKDIQNPSWFRLNHGIFEDPDFYDFTHEELVTWLYILCCASRANSRGTVRLHIRHAHRVGKIAKKSLIRVLRKLTELKIIKQPRNVDGTWTSRPCTHITDRQTDNTGQDKTYAHEQLFDWWWQKWKKKVEPGRAKKKLLTSVSESDFEIFKQAVENYCKANASKETKYWQHGKTFLSGWRDWVELIPDEEPELAESINQELWDELRCES